MHIWHTKSFNILVSIALSTLAHVINVYEICLNTTNYPIFNMQDFRYCLWTSILACFGQLVSPPWYMQILIDKHIFPYWDTHTNKIRCEKSVIGWITWCVGSCECFSQSQYTLPRTNNSILQLIRVVGVYKIYSSNIECPIIREFYRSQESSYML